MHRPWAYTTYSTVHVSTSIYMITRCVCVPTYVAGGPGVWCGVPIDLVRHKEGAQCGRSVISQGQRRSNYKAMIARTAGSRRAWLGRGDRGWATTELRLNNYDYRARPGLGLRRTVATVAERLPVCTCGAWQTACWMSRRGGYRQCQTNFSGICRWAETERRSKE